MQVPLGTPPSKADRHRLAVPVFFVAWLIGNIALIIGLNGAGGTIPAVCGFAIACVVWWGGYRLGGAKSRVGTAIGFLGIGIWTLNLLGAIVFMFRHYVADLFFWCSTIALFLLVMALALSKPLDRAREP